jgi:hypothetical protein
VLGGSGASKENMKSHDYESGGRRFESCLVYHEISSGYGIYAVTAFLFV